jgi:streptogramin lyase
MRLSTLAYLGPVFCLLLACADLASAGLFGISSNRNLYDVNQTTGAASNPRFVNVSGPAGIAFASDGTLYVLGASGTGMLYKVNPTTGSETLVGSTGLTVIEGDIAIDPTTGVIYGAYYFPGGSGRNLITINPTTGAGSVVFALPSNSDVSALAFDSSGNLFAIDSSTDRILQLNKTTGAVLSSVALSVPLGVVAGMAFDPATGVLYAADGNVGGTNNLYTVNTTTGAMTLVGPVGIPFNPTTNVGGLSGLAFSPSAVPEPSTLTMFGVGALGLVGAAVRRRKRAA